MLVLALVFAAVSAGGLGAGLLGIVPILENILNDPTHRRNLPQIVGEWNDKIGGLLPQGWIDALPRGPFEAVFWLLIGLGVLTVVGAIANFMHAYLSLTVVSRTVANVRRDAYRKALHLPMRRVLTMGPSDIISRIVYDTAALGSGFNALLSKAVAQVTKGMAAVIAALIVEWRLASVAMLTAPVVFWIIKTLGKKIRRASRKALTGQAGLYRSAAETLSGLRVVKSFTTERLEAGRFHRINKEVVRQEMRVRTARALSSPLIEVIALFILGALSLVAVKAILQGHLEPARFLAALAFLGVAASSLKPLTGFINDIQQAGAAADRLEELLAMPNEEGHGHRLPKLARHTRSIRFEEIALTYPPPVGDKVETREPGRPHVAPALNGVTLEVSHGETVAFVGPNGSGKTTLLSLIPRLLDPDKGRVLIDGTDIRDVSVRSLRRQIGVVTQDTVLFRGSIRWNIEYGSAGLGGGINDEDVVRRSAAAARADGFILARDEGYDSQIGEQGVGLSGGQRQRLAIARALSRDPAILILDEATSMIDAESEAKIAEAIAEFSKGRTCLIVAHRLSTVLSADRIVVMDAGRVVDQGTHAELLARCEVYRQIAQNQLKADPNSENLAVA